MSAFKPIKVPFSGLFEYDYRVEGKFVFVDRVLQPIIALSSDGRLMRAGMIEDEIENSAGNVAIAAFPDAFLEGQVWVIDHVGFQNGGAAAKLVGMALAYDANMMFLGSDAAVGIGAPQEFLSSPIYIDDQVGLQVLIGGAAADIFSIHARRIA